jgi:multidrug efflux pump subunit AcrB
MQLPEGAYSPIVIDDFGDVYGMFYGMTAEGFSYEEMDKYAQFIKKELLAMDGVSKVQIYGMQEPVINITLRNEKMSEMGIFPYQIISTIQSHNTHVYPGSFISGSQNLRLHIDEKFQSLDDIRSLQIKSNDGKLFELADIAEISKSYKYPESRSLHINNEKALGISISMEHGGNIIELGKRVEEKMSTLQSRIPIGFNFEKVFFQPDLVKDSIDGFMWNLVASILIVIVVLMFTMGLRGGLIIGSGLALTILATFPILYAAGGTLQRISLGAFIVAMGMLVDNAIVVIDGILVDIRKNGIQRSSFLNSAKRTAGPLLGATLIAIVAFLPVYLSPDTAGTYVKDLFVVLCISLLISWILALTQVPLFSASMMKINLKDQKKALFDGPLYNFIRKVLTYSLRHKFIIVIIAAILLGAAGYSFKYVQDTFFPDFNYNQVYIEYKLPEGTSAEKVNQDLSEITDHFLSFEEVKLVASSHGTTPSRYCLVRAMGEVSNSYGELIVNFEDYKQMIKMKPILEEYLHNNYPEANTRIRKYNLSVASSHTVEIEFQGPDPAVLRDLSRQAENIMAKSPYTNTYTVCNDWAIPAKTLHVDYDKVKANKAGISRSDVSNALLAATDGLPIGTFHEGEDEYTLTFRTRNENGDRITDLNEIPVWPMLPNISAIDKDIVTSIMTGAKDISEISNEIITPLPLSTVSNGITMLAEESKIRRLNGKRTIQAQCDPWDEYSPVNLTNDIIDEVNQIQLPEGYTMQFVGEEELKAKGTKNIYGMLPLSLVLIIIILLLLFNDLKKPLLILLCIPMAAIGIVPGHILTGIPFSFVSIIGAFGLMGMLIKNSIVLVDEIGKQIKEGVGRYTAIVNSTVSRTRPVMMASFTTILGMIPLFNDPMYKSMAVTIISGLLVGTLITLVFAPILYAVFHGVSNDETESTKIITNNSEVK